MVEFDEHLQSESSFATSSWSPMPKDRRADALGDLRVLPDEILCSIFTFLPPHDVGRLSCVSSVMYIFCNEEPLWMSLCLKNVNRPLQYRGSWKKTTFHQLDITACEESCQKSLHFDGFYSLFLYRRLYRCHTTLDGFSFDDGNVERMKELSLEEFHLNYDGQKPVLIDGLADTWPARKAWTLEQLLMNYGDVKFHLSQRSPKKILMNFKDYVSYMQTQHDEDPLYVFDDKFGEVASSLLQDYSVPHLFQEDFFDVLNTEERPPFRWLIVGPERSGASWHVDPALTSAWNTLLCGRKRWALYPPGKVPLGVTVHVNEDDGDVNIDTPSSLQWWLDFYPLLSDEDKPIECTQLPGETIFVPSGWWHCVLNLETTVAVTQNFVNSKNFEFVCLDMAPGYKHKGLCRAGLLALDDESSNEAKKDILCLENSLNIDHARKEKRARVSQIAENPENADQDGSECNDQENVEFSYDISFLSRYLNEERDHYNSLWSSSNIMEQRKMREWLYRLWLGKPELRDLIWKGACLALNAGWWFRCVGEICAFHKLSLPTDDEKLPVGTGSNPVYLTADNVIKIFIEDGLEASLYCLGTELQFYHLLEKTNSQLKNHIPRVLASGILFLKDGTYQALPWDGKDIPEVIAKCNFVQTNHEKIEYPFGVWEKKQFEYKKLGLSFLDSVNTGGVSTIWPYMVIERCRGKTFAEIRDTLSWEVVLNLASFLGEQLRNLHLLPCPSLSDSTLLVDEQKKKFLHRNGYTEDFPVNISIPEELKLFSKTLNKKKEDVRSRLTNWGEPIPGRLMEKVGEYIPEDINEFLRIFEEDMNVAKSYTWIHSDVMDDNIQMEQCSAAPCSLVNISCPSPGSNGFLNGSKSSGQSFSWHPCHLIDFSDLTLGHPICDVIPIHLDVFRGDSRLLQQFLESYKLPLVSRKSVKNTRYGRPSYLAMCYSILHDENVLGAIFSIWKELRFANSWEEVEEKVWGDLNNYTGFC